jgi:hypothetical protein
MNGSFRLNYRYVVLFGALALLTLFLLGREVSSERKIDRSPSATVTQATIMPPEQNPTQSQLARTTPSAGSPSGGDDPAPTASASSSDPRSDGRSGQASPGPSCSAKAHGVATEPQSPEEVVLLVDSYMEHCSDTLFSAIDEIYEQEDRDENWGTRLEEKMRQTPGTGGVRVEGTCHRSICHLGSATSQPVRCPRVDVEFDHALIKSVDGTELQGEIIYGPGCSWYFLSTVVPPAFLEPLRQRMGDGG